jgi:putative ABC transport system ATP-binding protein
MTEGRIRRGQRRGAALVDLITRLTHQRATGTVLVSYGSPHLIAVDQIADVHDVRSRLKSRCWGRSRPGNAP